MASGYHLLRQEFNAFSIEGLYDFLQSLFDWEDGSFGVASIRHFEKQYEIDDKPSVGEFTSFGIDFPTDILEGEYDEYEQIAIGRIQEYLEYSKVDKCTSIENIRLELAHSKSMAKRAMDRLSKNVDKQ